MSTGITYEDIKEFDATYTYWTHAKRAVTGPDGTPGKKRFLKLIKHASAALPKESDKQRQPANHIGKQTRPHKTASTLSKQSDKSLK